MSTKDEVIVAQIRRGHPETDTYAAPSFSGVIARRQATEPRHRRSQVALAAVAAAVVLAVAGFAVLDTSQIGSSGTASMASVLTVVDLHTIALAAGVPDKAVVPLGDDTAVVARWRNGQVQLARASLAGSWNVEVIGSVDDPRFPDSATAVVTNLTCIDPNSLNGPSFIFGSLIENGETGLRIHGLTGPGGELINGVFLFVVAAQPGATFWIDGPKVPGAPSPWPTAVGVNEPAGANAYFVGTIAEPVPCK